MKIYSILITILFVISVSCQREKNLSDLRSEFIGSWKTANGEYWQFNEDGSFDQVWKLKEGDSRIKGKWKLDKFGHYSCMITHYKKGNEFEKIEEPKWSNYAYEMEVDSKIHVILLPDRKGQTVNVKGTYIRVDNFPNTSKDSVSSEL